MITNLSEVKPKRLSDEFNVFIDGEDFVIDFKTSKVAFSQGGTKFPPCCISTKDLFNENYDAAYRLDKIDNFVKPENWDSIIINTMDVSIFNAISSAGEDIFWNALLAIENKQMIVYGIGLIYTARFLSPKMTDLKISTPLDYNACYYLYQMFKGITGKKTAIMKIAKENGYVYFTNEEESYYIAINLKSQELAFKAISCGLVFDTFKTFTFGSVTSVTKKGVTDKFNDSLLKHLIKFLGDNMSFTENDLYLHLYNNFGELYLSKKKENNG